MSDAPKDLTDERLDWHILTLQATKESARSIWQNEQLAFYLELKRRRASDRWIPWKPGDALPADGEYLVTMQDTETHADERRYISTWTALWRPCSWVHSPERRAIAYWSRPLPPPFDSSIAASKEGE